jgi:hypothetical protein
VNRQAIVLDAALELAPETDPRAPGGEITAELCGSWDHDGRCRWPHNTAIETTTTPARLRTIVVVVAEDRPEVLERIGSALRRDERWRVLSVDVRGVTDDERPLADRLERA